MLPWKSSSLLLKSTWLFRFLAKVYTIGAVFIAVVAIICLYFSLRPNADVFDVLKMSHRDVALAGIYYLVWFFGIYFVLRNIWYRLADIFKELALGEWTSKKMLSNLKVLPVLFVYAYGLDVFDWVSSFFSTANIESAAAEHLSAISWLDLLLPNFQGPTNLILALLFYVLYVTLSERQQMTETVRAIEEEHKFVI